MTNIQSLPASQGTNGNCRERISTSHKTSAAKMESSQEQPQPRPQGRRQEQEREQEREHEPPTPHPLRQFATRTSIRRAIHEIILRILRQRLDHLRASGLSAASRPTRKQRRRARRQASLLEDVLYRRACDHAEYEDPTTLEDRVLEAGRAVYVAGRRREAERARRRREAALALALAATTLLAGGEGSAGEGAAEEVADGRR